MSNDLVTHSILRPELGSMAVGSIADLKQLCTYVIYHATFAHSWTNEKQWDDGCDPQYASLGLWDPTHPEAPPARIAAIAAAQVRLGWNLSRLHYNPIMEDGPSDLKRLLFRAKDDIEPGLPVASIMMSINI